MYIEYTHFDNEEMKHFYNIRADIMDGRFTKSDCITDIPKGKHPIYINYFGAKNLLDPIAQELKPVEEVSFAYYKDSYSEDWLIEIYSSKASKANGANELKKLTGADSITAFGDNLNDIIMLKSADIGIAVENCAEELREFADIIIGTNENDSVVKFIDGEINMKE